MFRSTAAKETDLVKAQKQTVKPVLPPKFNLFEDFSPIKKNEALLSPVQLTSVSKMSMIAENCRNRIIHGKSFLTQTHTAQHPYLSQV